MWEGLESSSRVEMIPLLEPCASEAEKKSLIHTWDVTGKTPFHIAVDIGFEEGVLILLEHGTDLLL